MRNLRTNTATRITVGPFLDVTDGYSPETALTVTSCKLTMTVDNGGVPTLILDTNPTASGGNNDMVHITGDDAGFYDLELTAANLNYVGRAMLAITDAATHRPVVHEFMIVPAMVYDSMVLGTDTLEADMTAINGALTNDYSATLKLKKLDIYNTDENGEAVAINSDTGVGLQIYSGTDNAVQMGSQESAAVGMYSEQSAGLYIYGQDDGLSNNPGVLIGTGGSGVSIDASQGVTGTLTAAEVNTEVVDVIRTDVIPDSVADDGSRPTVAQALLMITRFLMEKSVSSTTVTVRKEDGSTSSMVFMLNDATNPTSITRDS